MLLHTFSLIDIKPPKERAGRSDLGLSWMWEACWAAVRLPPPPPPPVLLQADAGSEGPAAALFAASVLWLPSSRAEAWPRAASPLQIAQPCFCFFPDLAVIY